MDKINQEVLNEILNQIKPKQNMDVDYYRKIIYKRDNKQTGIAFGQMIKDKGISPETYNQLCIEAKKEGFRFSLIEFVK